MPLMPCLPLLRVQRALLPVTLMRHEHERQHTRFAAVDAVVADTVALMPCRLFRHDIDA